MLSHPGAGKLSHRREVIGLLGLETRLVLCLRDITLASGEGAWRDGGVQ
jgi:hypothetical protein